MTSSSSSSSVNLAGRFISTLEHHIQVAIAQTTEQSPLVRCRFQQGRLLVLSEDTRIASTALERDRQFRALAFAISKGLTAIDLPNSVLTSEGELPIRLYLRQRGKTNPYAARNWQWRHTDETADPFCQSDPALSANTTDIQGENPAGALVLVSSPMDSVEVEGDATLPFNTSSSATTSSTPESSPNTSPAAAEPPAQQHWNIFREVWQEWPWRSVVGLTAMGLLVGGITYSISRPCLIGSCSRRQTASDLSQAAITQLQGTPTRQDISLAHDDLLKAVRLLRGIPSWSPHYDTAQAELLRYRTQLSDVEWIMRAQKNAVTAAEKSQNPPHPVPLWTEVHLLWKKALKDLRGVSPDSPMANFAQQKLVEYETNHEIIGKRLAMEVQAEANLNAALPAAQAATARAKNATTLAEWLLAQQEWQRAVDALSQIPQGTLAYDEALTLLQDYRLQLSQTRTVVNREKAGDRAYQDALKSVAAAQEAAQANQWTLSVEQWRRAITHLRQVPENSIPYAEAQDRTATYQASLEQAQSRLQQAVALQTIEDDLISLCPLDLGICTYSYSSNQVELILMGPYASAVRQSISPPSTQGHLSQASSVVGQTHQLVQDIMRIGNRVQIPIVLYDTNRRFIARYKPEYGGFVKRP